LLENLVSVGNALLLLFGHEASVFFRLGFGREERTA
jgi:hypothetical protein